MKEFNIFTSKRYRSLDGKQKNELIRKIQRLLGSARYSLIEDALEVINPRVEECREYVELTRIHVGDSGSLFSRISSVEHGIDKLDQEAGANG